MNKTIKKNLQKEIREINLSCDMCSGKTFHSILAQVDVTTNDQGMTAWDNYSVVCCGGCRAVSFCKESRFSEDYVVVDENGDQDLDVVITMYPFRNDFRKTLIELNNLPGKIKNIYLETHNVFSAGNLILVGIGIRALLEAIVNNKKVPGRDLFTKINEMVPLGLITNESAKILHKLRILGNKSAHEVMANSKYELNVALDVIEHLLISVYVIPKKSKQIKIRKK